MPSVRFQRRRTTVCIIVPVCNEREALDNLRVQLSELEAQLATAYDTQYIVVDDGSTDGTAPLLNELAPMGRPLKVLTHAHNQGIGAAFRTAFGSARAHIVCTVDADCTYPLNGLPAMIAMVDRGVTDVVVASPYHPEGGVEGVSRFRIFLSRQCSRMYRLFGPLNLCTYTSIFRVYRGSLIRDAEFRCNGFESAVELLFCAEKLGYRISEMPMTLHRRRAGRSKMAVLRTICRHTQFLGRHLKERLAPGDRLQAPRRPLPQLAHALPHQLTQDGHQ